MYVWPEAGIVGESLNSGPGVITARLELHRHLQG